MHRIWRGPLARLAEALPEARYEVILALLRTSLCLTGALSMLVVASSTSRVAPVVANLAIAAASLAAAAWFTTAVSADVARRYGRWSTAADVAIYASYTAAFHDRPGAASLYGVFVLLMGPMRYGLRGLPVTVLPVCLVAVVWPQADATGSHLSLPVLLLLCLGFSMPAVVVRALLMRGSGRLRLAEQMLMHQAAHDPLTDLPNRTRALAMLEKALGDGEQVGVLFLDLDRFKVVNDGLGHAAGDQLLVQVASRLREVMRSGDLVARLGGDEFVVLCRHADAATSEAVATRILAVLAAPVTTPGGLELVIGASIGIAAGGRGDFGDLLLADADTAMYAAKAAGGGRVRVFTSDLREALVRSHELEVDLRAAVRRGGLTLVYQPMLDLQHSSVLGCEALVRWQDTRWGAVSPEEFVALAEQSDLILELGDWVLAQAVTDAAVWPLSSAGRAPSVSVNVSLRQLSAPGFADQVAEHLERTGVDPTRLCLEVTETMLAGDVEPIIEVLESLRSKGIRLSIDDFGTGHASLTYLARFPVDQVKIDRSFVAGLGVNAGSAAIVGGVVAMAHTFDLRVTAEGVETEEQLALLRGLGCDVVQGFLLSLPLTQDALLAALDGPTTPRRAPVGQAAGRIPTPRGDGLPRESQPFDLSTPEVSPDEQRRRLLVEGAMEVTGRLDLDAVLRHAFIALRRAVAFTGGSIQLVEDEQVRIAAGMPEPTPEALAARLPLGQGVSGAIAVSGEPRYLPDITIASTVTAGRRAGNASTGVRSWYGVPLISEGRPIGVLQIDSTTVDAFSDADRLAVLSFAPVVALAVVCARNAAAQLRAIQGSV